ncbi:amidase signature enzyme [Laetiporus sulphureus 93-53]|uniref:Glutamyl-tRNA(Gln) amidotransferase subunit A, mitochondrial n=1 Tax=Laetiporus sulphureus 93-53 TaxID=1314785 RepID=A0A165B9T3_9APHY|nr:amidase signature enzyme [Laetiporus sulphureus 93-53]KZT00578.1 amidase signature enzyme [Laetiporus sulphureus 93-53]
MPQSTDVGLPLHNVSVAVKDNICTSTMPTTCSSAMLQNFTSPFDATVVTLMRQAGAAIIGKTNCDEFGMGSLNTYSVHGPVINPFQTPHSTVSWVDRERRSAGGSSGGSAAAVAADMCNVALGTDTGGSTRLPASYCGIVGFKPSYGLISRWGVVSYADSLDCVGIMARAVDDVEKVFDVLVEYDPKDPTAVRPATRRKASQVCDEHYKHLNLGDSLVGLRIGIPQEYFPAELNTSVLGPLRQVLAHLQSRGAQLVPVSLPSAPYALSAYYVISSAEASSNMARYDGIQYGLRVDPPAEADKTKTANVYAHSRSAGFGKEVQKRILLGTYALTADAFDNYFLQAQRVRKLIRQDFDRAFRVPNVLSSQTTSPSSASQAESDRVHVLIHPSAIRTAPPLPAPGSATDGEGGTLDTYVQDVLTVPASLAGLPALGVSAGFGEDGWPVGVSIVGQWGCDKMVLDIGRLCAECAA